MLQYKPAHEINKNSELDTNKLFSQSLSNTILDDVFVDVYDILPQPIHMKLEGLNACGSIKIKTALQLIDDLEVEGRLKPGGTVIESSSGNLGIALATIAAAKNYRFICVTDPNAAACSIHTMKALGAEVIVVDQKDENGGYLQTRINLIKEMCLQDESMVWINQYANPSNWKAHYLTTAPQIHSKIPEIDWLIIGAGTTGTLMGCARYFRDFSPATRIVAIDTLGSVTFGGEAGKRMIPGLGTSIRPPITDDKIVDDVVYVPEEKTIKMCWKLAERGLLVGGSTGTVLAGIQEMGVRIGEDDVVATISPDMGTKYLNTIYDEDWVAQNFPELSH